MKEICKQLEEEKEARQLHFDQLQALSKNMEEKEVELSSLKEEGETLKKELETARIAEIRLQEQLNKLKGSTLILLSC